MATKKKSPWWMEPVNLVFLMVSAVRFVFDFVVIGVKSMRSDVQDTTDAETTRKNEKARYLEVRKTLDNDDAKKAWRRSLITGLCLQGFLMLQIVLQIFSANIYMVLTLITILSVITILFGYRAWILVMHRYNSFGVYLKNLPTDYKCLFLWNAFTALD